MQFKFKGNNYKEMCAEIYDLIMTEMSEARNLEFQYPKFVVMYEFFRLLRGEAFTNIREPIGDQQKDLYKMEDEIQKKLQDLKSKLHDTERANMYLDEMKKSFDL